MRAQWHTETEIFSQPDIWAGWASELAGIAGEIRTWIERRRRSTVWLCGAGTSSYIGETLCPRLSADSKSQVFRPVATTDLVAAPYLYVRDEGRGLLVVSFGRSGDSSETVGALDILDRCAPYADRLNISCNKNGTLTRRSHPGPGQQRIVLLPDSCHDLGFAMTSSYSTMVLTALTVLGRQPVKDAIDTIGRLADEARRVLSRSLKVPKPARVVFLGSGPNLGTARESALKVLELAAGQVVTSWESTLGFRHGPKAVVDRDTAVFVYLSADPLTRKYDNDVAQEIRSQFPNTMVTTIGAETEEGDRPDIALSATREDAWNTVLYILIAQRLAVKWSKELGLNVDNPFTSGELKRVVSDVRLYV